MDSDPVRVTPDADVVDVTILMADYNLMTVPVVDADDQLLGVITVDDVLESTIPDDWRRREPPAHPEAPHGADATPAHAVHSGNSGPPSKPDRPTRTEPEG
jgi:CBS domain-containing protein